MGLYDTGYGYFDEMVQARFKDAAKKAGALAQRNHDAYLAELKEQHERELTELLANRRAARAAKLEKEIAKTKKVAVPIAPPVAPPAAKRPCASAHGPHRSPHAMRPPTEKTARDPLTAEETFALAANELLDIYFQQAEKNPIVISSDHSLVEFLSKHSGVAAVNEITGLIEILEAAIKQRYYPPRDLAQKFEERLRKLADETSINRKNLLRGAQALAFNPLAFLEIIRLRAVRAATHLRANYSGWAETPEPELVEWIFPHILAVVARLHPNSQIVKAAVAKQAECQLPLRESLAAMKQALLEQIQTTMMPPRLRAKTTAARPPVTQATWSMMATAGAG